MKSLQLKATQRLSAFLLQYGKRYAGKCNRTQAHLRWLEEMKFTQPVQQTVFQEYVETVKMLGKRVGALNRRRESAAGEFVFWPVIKGSMALRGANLLTTTTIVAEIGDLKHLRARYKRFSEVWKRIKYP